MIDDYTRSLIRAREGAPYIEPYKKKIKVLEAEIDKLHEEIKFLNSKYAHGVKAMK